MQVTNGVELHTGTVEAHDDECPCMDCDDLVVPPGMFRAGDFLLLRDNQIVELARYICTCPDSSGSWETSDVAGKTHRVYQYFDHECKGGWWETTEWSEESNSAGQFNDLRTLRIRIGNRGEMGRDELKRLVAVMHLRRFQRYCSQVEGSILAGPRDPWASVNAGYVREFLKRLKELARLVKVQERVLDAGDCSG